MVSPYAASKLKKMQLGDDSPDVALGLALEDLTLVEESRGSTLSPVVGAIPNGGTAWLRKALEHSTSAPPG